MQRLSLLPFLVLAFVLGSVAAARANTPRIVISVGHNQGHAGEERLRYAEKDAQEFASIFKELGASDHIRVLKSPQRNAVLSALSEATRISQNGKRDFEVIFYYAGHGDNQSLHLGGEKLVLAELRGAMAKIPARLRLTIIDSCRSSGGSAWRGMQRGAGFDIGVSQNLPQGSVVIASASPGEPAQESDDLQGAVFSHFLFSGLRGAADLNADHRVTLEEAYAFAHGRTLMRTVNDLGFVQRPSFEKQISGSGSIVLTLTSKAHARLVFPAEKDAQYFVYHLPEGDVLAEVHSNPQTTTTIAVPAGRMLVQRRVGSTRRETTVHLPWGGQTRIDPNTMNAVSATTSRIRGDSGEISEDRFTLAGVAEQDFSGFRGPAAGVALGMTHYLGDWGFGLFMRWTQGSLDLSLQQGTEWRLSVQPFIRYRLSSAWGEARASLALLVEPTSQHLEHNDSARLAAAGFNKESRYLGLTLGSALTIGGSIAIAPRWSIECDVGALLRSAQAAPDSELSLIFALTGMLGLGYNF